MAQMNYLVVISTFSVSIHEVFSIFNNRLGRDFLNSITPAKYENTSN